MRSAYRLDGVGVPRGVSSGENSHTSRAFRKSVTSYSGRHPIETVAVRQNCLYGVAEAAYHKLTKCSTSTAWRKKEPLFCKALLAYNGSICSDYTT